METLNEGKKVNNGRFNKKTVSIIITAGILLFFAVYALNYYFTIFVSTDNAFVEGHIVYISSKVPGFVKNVYVNDNEEIQAGKLLVEIDENDYAIRLEKAEKNYQTNLSLEKKAETEITAASNSILVAESDLQVADSEIKEAEAKESIAIANLELAEKDLERFRELFKNEFITQKQIDEAETRKINAKKELDLAKSKVAGAKSKKESKRALLKNSRSQVDVAKAGLEAAVSKSEEGKSLIKEAAIVNNDTRIVSPLNGFAGRKTVEKGQFVTPGQPLMAIVSSDDIWIVANYKETQLTRVKTGQRVKITADVYPDLHLEGVVESLSPASGAKFSLLPPENATGNFTKVVQRIPVKIIISGNDKFKLKPGMSVKTTIDTRS